MEIDAEGFDTIARTVFAPVYPVLAGQMLKRSGIKSGVALDLGSGGGYLGLALAELSGLTVYLLDESADMCRIAQRNVAERHLEARVVPLWGDVHGLPLESGSVNLVVSRGSIYFWNDLPWVLRETWRVLTPGGFFCLGGGFGSRQLREEVQTRMKAGKPDWQPKCRTFDDSVFDLAMADAALLGGEGSIIRDQSGTWLCARKLSTTSVDDVTPLSAPLSSARPGGES